MASLPKFLLAFAVVLLAAEMVTSAKPTGKPPGGSCREDLCIGDYRGDGTGADICSGKYQLAHYCPAKDEMCLVDKCKESDQCLKKGGSCIDIEVDCGGRSMAGLCGGHFCHCCIGGTERKTTLATTPYPAVDVCSGGNIILTDGETTAVASPGYPSTYGVNVNCLLSVMSPATPYVQIDFLYFDLETCNFDSLTINTTHYDVTYSGDSLPVRFFAYGGFKLLFQTDYSDAGGGFYITLNSYAGDPCDTATIYDICEENSVAATSYGRIISPGYDTNSNYVNFLDCNLTLTSPVGTFLSLEYRDFILEGSSSCLYDWLKVYDSTDQDGPGYCGTNPPLLTQSATDEVKFVFHTDLSVVRQGFDICFRVVTGNE